jgi:hypothetical protein
VRFLIAGLFMVVAASVWLNIDAHRRFFQAHADVLNDHRFKVALYFSGYGVYRELHGRLFLRSDSPHSGPFLNLSHTAQPAATRFAKMA